jgi:hypothetical protein
MCRAILAPVRASSRSNGNAPASAGTCANALPCDGSPGPDQHRITDAVSRLITRVVHTDPGAGVTSPAISGTVLGGQHSSLWAV